MDRKKDEEYMRRALDLAGRAGGRTSPNPMVGAVVVKNGRVIAQGYHQKAGQPHAEIEALRRAGAAARNADLVLNLEPCCHHGRTPPCTEAILASRIRRVVVGMRDPNPRVAGKGIRQLRRRGVEVVTGVLKKECERLNEEFVKFMRTGRPFVILKSAMSLDGKIATPGGESQWITGGKAREWVHRLRGKVDAVLVGAGTVQKDDPRLTTRLKKKKGKNPCRVILDFEGTAPLGARVFHHADRDRVIYVSSPRLKAVRARRLTRLGVQVWTFPERDGGFDLRRLLQKLGEEEIISLLVEGGGEVNASFLHAGMVDKLVLFYAPILIGGRDAPGMVGGEGIRKLKRAFKIKNLKLSQVGEDLMLEGTL